MQRKHGAVPGLSRQEVSQLERVGFSDGRLGRGREMKDGLPPPHCYGGENGGFEKVSSSLEGREME